MRAHRSLQFHDKFVYARDESAVELGVSSSEPECFERVGELLFAETLYPRRPSYCPNRREPPLGLYAE
jgi:hypothetical protein